MFAYYLRLGWRSLRRNPLLTMLMVLAMGLGVAASMTTYAVFRAVSADPIPQRSDRLYVPAIDVWGPKAQRSELPDMLTYTDAMALMRAHKAVHQAAIYPVSYTAFPQDATAEPLTVKGDATYAEFFPMFEVPFAYGGAWTADQDEARAAVIVISSHLNQAVFGGVNSVGRVIRLDDHDYRVVGVLADWNPQPRFYDVNVHSRTFAGPPDFFLPFTRAIDLQTDTDGNNSCYGSAGRAPGWQGWVQSNCVWLSLWVELPDAAAARDYRAFLESYSAEQKRSGRFDWLARVQLFNFSQWMSNEQVVPPEARMSMLLSLGFLFVCLVNTVGLLLAKFMRRSAEIGVRRALGASRKQIIVQFLAEAVMVGLAGGVVGLLLTGVGVLGIGVVFEPDIAHLAHMSPGLIGLTVLVSLAATVAAAFYPTWRAACVQPAWQLKAN